MIRQGVSKIIEYFKKYFYWEHIKKGNNEIHLTCANNKVYSSLCKILETFNVMCLEEELNLCISLANLQNTPN